MSFHLYIKIKDPITGEIEGSFLTNNPSTVVLDSTVIELNYDSNISKVSPNISKEYIYLNNELFKLPIQQFSYQKLNYTTRQWEDSRTEEAEWNTVRSTRDTLLKESDWTQMPDVQLPNKEAWAIYRQALRDITNQLDPFNITWPTAPGG